MSRHLGRRDVGPAGWELPVAAAVVWMCLCGVLLPAGRAITAALAGHGWIWPRGSDLLVKAIAGLITGDASAGLDATQAGALPSSGAVYTGIALVVLLFTGLSGSALWATRG